MQLKIVIHLSKMQMYSIMATILTTKISHQQVNWKINNYRKISKSSREKMQKKRNKRKNSKRSSNKLKSWRWQKGKYSMMLILMRPIRIICKARLLWVMLFPLKSKGKLWQK